MPHPLPLAAAGTPSLARGTGHLPWRSFSSSTTSTMPQPVMSSPSLAPPPPLASPVLPAVSSTATTSTNMSVVRSGAAIDGVYQQAIQQGLEGEIAAKSAVLIANLKRSIGAIVFSGSSRGVDACVRLLVVAIGVFLLACLASRRLKRPKTGPVSLLHATIPATDVSDADDAGGERVSRSEEHCSSSSAAAPLETRSRLENRHSDAADVSTATKGAGDNHIDIISPRSRPDIGGGNLFASADLRAYFTSFFHPLSSPSSTPTPPPTADPAATTSSPAPRHTSPTRESPSLPETEIVYWRGYCETYDNRARREAEKRQQSLDRRREELYGNDQEHTAALLASMSSP